VKAVLLDPVRRRPRRISGQREWPLLEHRPLPLPHPDQEDRVIAGRDQVGQHLRSLDDHRRDRRQGGQVGGDERPSAPRPSSPPAP
jgi:hypothetical protein